MALTKAERIAAYDEAIVSLQLALVKLDACDNLSADDKERIGVSTEAGIAQLQWYKQRAEAEK